MTPTTLILLVLACIRHGLISPFQVTCEPIVEWQGGPMVYRTTIKNVSRASIMVQYIEGAPLAAIRPFEVLATGFPSSRIGSLLGADHFGDSPPPMRRVRLEPGESMSRTRVANWLEAQARKPPGKVAAVWHMRYRIASPDGPEKWCTAEIVRPFAARPVKPTAAEIERFIKTDPPLEWLIGADKVEFLPLLTDRLAKAPGSNIWAMYSIARAAKLPLETIPKRLLLGQSLRGGEGLFSGWQDKESPTYPLPSKELIAELSRAPNEWVRLLTWVTFPDDVREPPAALKKVPELMLPAPTAAVAELVKQLDDSAFKVREDASRKLVRLADEVDDLAPMLQHVLSRPGTAEQLQRVRQVLDALPKVRSSADRIVGELEDMKTLRSTRLLGAVAAGPAALRATQDARRELKFRKELEEREKDEKDR